MNTQSTIANFGNLGNLGKLGRYQLVQTLGRGAMGIVYEGLDPKLNRQVAIKTILKSQLVDPDLANEYSARFEREAQAVARLNHPNIVTVFDFGNEADVAYLVMEFIRGKELKGFIDSRHEFGIADSVRLICELLEALEYAHANGVVHRDIKPANVMLDASGRVKLTDFGVARLADGAGQDRTKAGTMVGTPGYMSPEQIQGLPAGPSGDLFATGVVLYQCLTLNKPFDGDTEWATFFKIINGEPPPLATFREGVPPQLQSALNRALEKDPKNRYPSARAMINDLQAAVGGQFFEPRTTRFKAAQGDALPHANNSAPATRQAATTNLSQPPAAVTSNTSEAELEFWRAIKDSGDADEFELYLEKFPTGLYADLAKRKIAKMAVVATPAPVAAAEVKPKAPPPAAPRVLSAQELIRKEEEEARRRFKELARWQDDMQL